jgi:hypothetical protein
MNRPINPFAKERIAVLDYRHCSECRTQFAVHPTSPRKLCDDCQGIADPAFKRHLEEREAWLRDKGRA